MSMQYLHSWLKTDQFRNPKCWLNSGYCAGLGMVLNAVLTALTVPPVVRLFGFT
jgi:hypothetical protein